MSLFYWKVWEFAFNLPIYPWFMHTSTATPLVRHLIKIGCFSPIFEMSCDQGRLKNSRIGEMIRLDRKIINWTFNFFFYLSKIIINFIIYYIKFTVSETTRINLTVFLQVTILLTQERLAQRNRIYSCTSCKSCLNTKSNKDFS